MENVDSTLSLSIETSSPLSSDPASPIASLFFLGNNELVSRSFLLYPGLNYIGRNPSSQIFLPCRNLSRNHACIIHQLGSNFLFDCHSHNGSFRWNVPLLPDFRYELINGTEFTLANLSFRFLPLSDNALTSPFSYEHINNSSNLIFTSDEDEISSINIITKSNPGLTLLSSDKQINESPCVSTTQIVSDSIIDKTMSVASSNISLSTFFNDNSFRSTFNAKDNVHDLREFKTSNMFVCEFYLKFYTIILSNTFKDQNGNDDLHFYYSKFSKSTFISNGTAFSIREDIIDFSLTNNFNKYFGLLIGSSLVYLDHLQQYKLHKNSDVESTATILEDYIVENDSSTVFDCVDKSMVINCDNTPLNPIEKTERTDIQSSTMERLKLPIIIFHSQDSISKTPSMNEDLIYPISDKIFDFSSNKPHISFTYLMDSKYRIVVNSLGGIVEIDINKTTHLITDKIRRTFKFLCCLARGCEILSVDWLSKSKKAGRFLQSKNFLLSDKTNERIYGINLEQSCILARRKKLFSEYIFYLTPNILPTPKEMELIIEFSGGEVKENFLSSTFSSIFIITCHADLSLLPKFLIDSDLKKSKILSSEFVLTAVLKQLVEIEPFLLNIERSPIPQKRKSFEVNNLTQRRRKLH